MAQLLEQPVGGLAVEMDVEEDESRRLGGHGRTRLLECPGLTDAEPLELEVHTGQEPKTGVVFDHEDRRLLSHGGRSYSIAGE